MGRVVNEWARRRGGVGEVMDVEDGADFRVGGDKS